MYAQGQQVYILREGTTRERGLGAQAKNILAARAIADAVKSTLGPRGMDKMLVDSMGDVTITNDGAAILKEIDVQHPAAKMLIEVAKTQDQECGDGTTSSVILTGALLGKAEELLEQDIHATVVTAGFKMAAAKAQQVLKDLSIAVERTDKATLHNIAATALSSKSASSALDLVANAAVDACLAVMGTHDRTVECDINDVQVQKAVGASLSETQFIRGIILDKERVHHAMPGRIENAKIALCDMAFELKKTEVESKIKVTNPSQLEGFLAQEEKFIKDLVEKVVQSGANVLVCQKGIDDLAQHFLAKAGVYSIRRVKKSDMEKLAKATGAQIVSTLDDLTEKALGIAGEVHEEKFGDDKFTIVSKCKNPKAVSILLRGGTEHVVDEYERALHDALSVVAVALEDGRLLPGGGASHMEIASALRDYAPTVGGRQQMAVEAFADAVESIPRTLAANAGLDEIDILIELRRAHNKGNQYAGVNVFSGQVDDMLKLNVVEPLRVGTQGINSATEAATMILRIDDVIASKAQSNGGNGKMAPGGNSEPDE